MLTKSRTTEIRRNLVKRCLEIVTGNKTEITDFYFESQTEWEGDLINKILQRELVTLLSINSYSAN